MNQNRPKAPKSPQFSMEPRPVERDNYNLSQVKSSNFNQMGSRGGPNSRNPQENRNYLASSSTNRTQATGRVNMNMTGQQPEFPSRMPPQHMQNIHRTNQMGRPPQSAPRKPPQSMVPIQQPVRHYLNEASNSPPYHPVASPHALRAGKGQLSPYSQPKPPIPRNVSPPRDNFHNNMSDENPRLSFPTRGRGMRGMRGMRGTGRVRVRGGGRPRDDFVPVSMSRGRGQRIPRQIIPSHSNSRYENDRPPLSFQTKSSTRISTRPRVDVEFSSGPNERRGYSDRNSFNERRGYSDRNSFNERREYSDRNSFNKGSIRGQSRGSRSHFRQSSYIPSSRGRVFRERNSSYSTARTRPRGDRDQRRAPTTVQRTRGLGIPTSGAYGSAFKKRVYSIRSDARKNLRERSTKTNEDKNTNIPKKNGLVYIKKSLNQPQQDNEQKVFVTTRSGRRNEKIWQKKEDPQASHQEETRKVIESIFQKKQFAENGVEEEVLENHLKDYFYKHEVRQIRQNLKQDNKKSFHKGSRRLYRKVNHLNEQQIKNADESSKKKSNEIIQRIRSGDLQNDFEVTLSQFGKKLYKFNKKQEASSENKNDENENVDQNDNELDEMAQKLSEFIGDRFLIEDVQRLFSSHPLLNQFIDELTNEVFKDTFEKHVDTKGISFSKKHGNK